MNTAFTELFQHVCFDFYTSAVQRETQENPLYQELDTKTKDLFQSLVDKLGKEDKCLLKLEEAEIHKHAREEAIIYRQGMRDCLCLLRWMRELDKPI